jgi:hypothetical protein
VNFIGKQNYRDKRVRTTQKNEIRFVLSVWEGYCKKEGGESSMFAFKLVEKKTFNTFYFALPIVLACRTG